MNENPYEAPTAQAATEQPKQRSRMSVFDKFCAVFAFALGMALLFFGILGLFMGCQAYFTLPPLYGCLPAFVGWGIVRAIYLAWIEKVPLGIETDPAKQPALPTPTARPSANDAGPQKSS